MVRVAAAGSPGVPQACGEGREFGRIGGGQVHMGHELVPHSIGLTQKKLAGIAALSHRISPLLCTGFTGPAPPDHSITLAMPDHCLIVVESSTPFFKIRLYISTIILG